MAVKIRLTRGGSKKRPFYWIVAADARMPRDGRYIEKIGTYNPLVPHGHAERLVFKQERLQHWLSTGAQPTDRLQRMFGQLGLLPAYKIPNNPKKSALGAKAQARVNEKLAKEEARIEAEKAAAEAAIAEAEAAKAAAEAAPVAEEAVAEEAPKAEGDEAAS